MNSAESTPAASCGGSAPARAVAAARTRVKICGLTRTEDAQAACRFGADAIGLIFYPPSPRGIGLEQAAVVRGGLPPFVTAVGVFVNADSEFVTRAIREVSLDVIQFHGDEDAGYCASFGKPYIKAVQVREGLDLHRFARRYSSARALLLDSFEPQRRGGTGNIFDWSLIPVDLGKPYILAGGLGPDNVAAAIAKASPYAVDGNGGVESSPGVKDPEKIEAFIREVNRGTTS
jgi:phosphoribosylanthranilate isomerase